MMPDSFRRVFVLLAACASLTLAVGCTESNRPLAVAGEAASAASATTTSAAASAAASHSATSSPASSSSGAAEPLSIAEASRAYLTIEAANTGRAALGGVVPGRVAFRPQAMAAIGTPIAARVVSVDVRPGESVKAGAVLLTLQSAEAAAARSSLDHARAKSAAAEDLLRRQRQMLDKGVGLEVERFAAETALREADAELERARRTLAMIGDGRADRFVLRAPASGIVLTVRTHVGGVVVPGGEALVEVGDPAQLWIVAELPENEVARTVVGQRAQVRIPGADVTLEAVVDGLGRVVDGEQRRLPIYLTLRRGDEPIAAGMQAEVRLQAQRDSLLSVPVSAVLIKDGSRRLVYVQRDDGRFEPRPVRTGVSREGRVTILDGLAAGEKVVVRGALLIDGEAEQLL